MSILIKSETGLTSTMLKNWTEAAQTFQTQMLASSPLTNGKKNQVVLWGISQSTHGIKDFGATSFYLANGNYDGCQDGDHDNFIEVWSVAVKKPNSIPQDITVRMVIAVNLTKHRSAAQIYATLLHEWFVHAVRWSGVISYIREGKGAFALVWVQGQGAIRREAGEHAQFKDWSNEDVVKAVGELGLEEEEKQKVIKLINDDRSRY